MHFCIVFQEAFADHVKSGLETSRGLADIIMLPLKADFHLTFFVRAGVAPKSEHVQWSRFCVRFERQKIDRVSTFWRLQRTQNRDHLILTTHAQIWALRCVFSLRLTHESKLHEFLTHESTRLDDAFLTHESFSYQNKPHTNCSTRAAPTRKKAVVCLQVGGLENRI